MADVTTEFNSVYVVESLGASERHTGRGLYDGVLDPFQKTSRWFEAEYIEAPDRASFLGALERVLMRARAGRLPILHLEAHGSRAGIHLADGDVVRWEHLRESLTAINQATRFRLVVVMAMCKGAYLATVLRPPHPAPALAVIGAEVDVDDLPMEAGMWMQYDALLSGNGGDASLEALNAEQSDPVQRYHLRSAELLFHDALHQFFRKRDPEIVQEHENRLVAESTKEWGYGIDIAMKARQLAKMRLRDERYWYDFWRPLYLMLDQFPENESRFKLTFDEYKAAQVRGPRVSVRPAIASP